MERYLEIDVTKMVSSILFVKVDDQDERYKKFFSSDKGEQLIGFSNIRHKLPLVEAVKKTIDDSEWDEYPLELEVQAVKEVSKEEAEKYVVFNAI